MRAFLSTRFNSGDISVFASRCSQNSLCPFHPAHIKYEFPMIICRCSWMFCGLDPQNCSFLIPPIYSLCPSLTDRWKPRPSNWPLTVSLTPF